MIDKRDIPVTRTSEGLRQRYNLEGMNNDINALIKLLKKLEGEIPDFPLSIPNGGTGSNTIAEAKATFGVPDFPLTLANGGFGVSNDDIHAARNNLGMGTLLWSGAWSSGNITVPGFDEYTFFKVTLQNRGATVLAAAYDGFFRGIGGFISVAPQIYNYAIAATYTGNALTWVDARNVQIRASTTNSAYTADVIDGIYGLL